MNTQEPIIFRAGKRLYLRPLLREDMAQMTVWINDPEVTQYLRAIYPMTPEEEVIWQESLKDKKDEEIILAIVLKEGNRFIGTMGFHGIDFRNGLATTGSVIGDKSVWGKGYGTEAKMLLLDYAFNTLNLRKICSTVYDINPRSKRCLEKCGYREEGCLKKQQYRNGTYRDEFIMAVFKEEFAPIWEEYKKTHLAPEVQA